MQTPNDLALLITAPLAEEDFFSDLRDPNKDFVQSWAKRQRTARRGLADEALWEIYSDKIKNFVIGIAKEIASLGVKVVFNAKLDDIRPVFSEKKIVILEAHWFSPKFREEDFYDPPEFVKDLYSSDEIIAKALREDLSSFGSELPIFPGYIEKKKFSLLVKQINEIIAGYNDRDRVAAPIFVSSEDKKNREELWVHLSRFELENTFPDSIKNRCRIEMFDGLCSLEDLIDRIPLNFDGVIDLTVCNSELAGKFIKRFRPECLVITNRHITDLRFRLILLKGAIEMLQNGNGGTYVGATFELRKQLLQIIEEK